MKATFGSIVGSLVLAAATPAASLTLECTIPPTVGGGGYITELYIFQYDESAGTALASDGLILYYLDAPIAAKVTDDTPKKLAFSWGVTFTNNSGQQTRMTFRAVYFRATRKMTVTATPGSAYVGGFDGRGTCREV